MTTKFSDSLHGIRRMSNEKHVLLRADDCSQSLAEDRMILYAQDTNRLALNHCNGPVSAIVMVCLSAGQSLDLAYFLKKSADQWTAAFFLINEQPRSHLAASTVTLS